MNDLFMSFWSACNFVEFKLSNKDGQVRITRIFSGFDSLVYRIHAKQQSCPAVSTVKKNNIS